MELTATHLGADTPLEGDLTLFLQALPSDAKVTAATVTLTPVAGPDGLFVEKIHFSNGQGDHGTTKVSGMPVGPNFIEIDFHARRTLASVEGSGLDRWGLQVDLGGLYVDIGGRGTIRVPPEDPFKLKANGNVYPLPGLTVQKFKLTAPAAAQSTGAPAPPAPAPAGPPAVAVKS